MKSKFALAMTIFSIITGLAAADFSAAQQANTPVLTIEKRVRNLSRGEQSFAVSTSAVAGERVQFQITISTVGSTVQQTGVVVRDSLHARLALSVGSAELFTVTGLNLGNLNAGLIRTEAYEVIVSGDAPATIANTATVKSDQLADRQSTANVVVTSGQAMARDLEVTNRLLNITAGETTFTSATTARAGDRLRLQVTIRATGNASVSGITALYSLSNRLAIASSNADVVVNPPVVLGSLRPAETRTITFEVRVLDGDAVNLINTVRVQSAEVAAKDVTNTVVVRSGTAATVRILLINTRALNLSRSDVYAETVSANAGDTLRFEIRVNALGNAPQSSVIVLVNLPGRLTFLDGDQNLTNTGMFLGSLPAGEVRTITFEAKVNPGSPETFSVTSSVRSDEAATVNDAVTINIVAVAVPAPAPAPPSSQVAGKTILPPRTGPWGLLAVLPAILTTAGYALYRRQSRINKPKQFLA